jgi:hypothetical protein
MAFIVALIAAFGGGATSSPAHTQRFFAPSSVWNSRLPRNAPLDPSSPALVAELLHERSETTAWINTTDNSTPIYTVGARRPVKQVVLDTASRTPLRAAFRHVPMPAGAKPASGGDGNLVVWQPSTDTLWEFWHLNKQAGVWHADWGGRMRDVSKSPGYYRNRRSRSGAIIERRSWGAPATGLSLAGGVMTLKELERGRINHALYLAIPQPRAGVWARPASRTDGTFNSPTAIPEGARFRLDPRLDLHSLKLPRVTLMMAKAAQRYGIIVNNTAGAVTFRAEDPAPTGTNPYPDLFGKRTPRTLLDRFPWAHLELMRMHLVYAKDGPDLVLDHLLRLFQPPIY